jgi:hypothetical protein
VALYLFPTLFGLFAPPADRIEFVRHVGVVWLAIGIGGGLFRVVQLSFTKDVPTGLIWAFKVLSDPFHNIALYYKSPLALLRGEWIDTSIDTADWHQDEAEEAPHLG